MLSERSLLLSGYNNNSIESTKESCDESKTPPPNIFSVAQAALTVTPTTTAAAAAAYLYLEKVKNERMSPRVTASQIDSLKDVIMESSAAAAVVAAAMVNNNNCSSINNNNNSNKNSNNGSGNSCSSSSNQSNNSIHNQNPIGNTLTSPSDEIHSHTLPLSSSSPSSNFGQTQQHQQAPSSSMHLNSNHVKKERLSPTGTNGDLQSALSRSRSTTPLSFRGTSPQHSVHSSPSETVVPMHNISTNLLSSIQQAASSSSRNNSINFSSGPVSGLPSEFTTRNYSDFMRSLAAKYNNTNPTDSTNSRRQALFDASANNATKKTSSTTTKTSHTAPVPSTSISKEVSMTATHSLPRPNPLTSGAISPGETALSQAQQSQMAAAAVASAAAANASGSVSPFMTSFLSSLPFAQGIFPPLIDMSSTQALITLARAAKETEMQNILHQNSKPSTVDVSPSPTPSLNMALQQAAQFISPALIYSVQVQKQQQVSRQSSPHSTNITNSSSSSTNAACSNNAGNKRNASPLDLSSQTPTSKRFKAESTSSQSSSDGLLTTTIKRRTSTSTATTTPSPPPHNENSSSSPAATANADQVHTACTPITIANSTLANYGSSTRQCQAHSEEVNSWTVHDVCSFVGSIDICAEYVKVSI
uniref:Uncharacterized protein n=1 Tax=Stomoxys calcitrans TaxID=35570 RepID=A0A1I8PRF8_STOCA